MDEGECCTASLAELRHVRERMQEKEKGGQRKGEKREREEGGREKEEGEEEKRPHFSLQYRKGTYFTFCDNIQRRI